MSKKAIIIGGGPAGLTAAYEFATKTDILPIIIEKSSYWGGISRTVNFKGNRIDIGGHRFFSKSKLIMDWWINILPIYSEQENFEITYQNKTQKINNDAKILDAESVFLVRPRKSRIYFNNSFFDYPISLTPNAITKLGFLTTFLIGCSYFKSVLSPIKDEKSLEDFLINRFGKKLYSMFFKDYTEKIWGIKCSEISPEWGAQRIKGLSISKTILHFFRKTFFKKNNNIEQQNTETSLIEYFLYPKYGPGQLWDKVALEIEKRFGKLKQNENVTSIITGKNRIISIETINEITGEKNNYEGDYFISTMPVQELILSLDQVVPKNVLEVSNGLIYRNFITVGILLKKLKLKDIKDNWIYIQEPTVKIGRLQIFNNWSPFLVKDPDTIWLGLEYFCDEKDEIWNFSEEQMVKLGIKELSEIGLIDATDLIDSVVIKMPKTYPAYFGSYNRFNEIREYLDQFENLFLIGRNGMHKYNNQDHSMLTAIEAVKNIKNGIKSKENIWAVNTEQDYHEEK